MVRFTPNSMVKAEDPTLELYDDHSIELGLF